MLRVNFSTSLSTQTTRLPILPRLTGSRRLLVPSTACPFSLPCPHLPTLSVTCPAQPSGPPAPPKLSHCTLAQSTSFPHLPRTLWFPEWSPLWTTGHTYHGNPTPQHTDTHHSKCPTPQPVLTWLSRPRPWSETLIWIHGNSYSLAFSTATSASFPKILSCWLAWSHPSYCSFSVPLASSSASPINEDILPAVQSLSSAYTLVGIFNPSHSHNV